MGDRHAEKRVFEAFLRAKPGFAGRKVVDWTQPDRDPPDVCCTLSDGKCVGVELTEWLHEGQTRAGKQREKLEESILKALDPLPPNKTVNIRTVSMTPRPDRPRFVANDAVTFRAQLLALIAEIDQSPTDAAPFGQRSVSPRRDFGRYPTLGKYLSEVDFQPRDQVSGDQDGATWIATEPQGGWYAPDPAVEALGLSLDKKIQKRYSSEPRRLDEFHLLVYYTQGWFYNEPLSVPGFDLPGAARWASGHIGNKPGPFDRIWLFIPGVDPPQVFRLYPRPDRAAP